MVSRDTAYEQVSHYVVHNCDVLVVVWNGKCAVGQREADKVVEYARKVGRSIFWVHSESGKVTEERHEDKTLESLERLNAYNRERLSHFKFRLAVKAQFDVMAEQAKNVALSLELLNPLRRHLLPQFVCVDLLAERYRDRHMKAGSAIYALAGAAVATVTIQLLFFKHLPGLLWLEVAEMASILLLLSASRIGNWHRKWIDYRFLAECLRAGVFFRVAGIKYKSTVHLSKVNLSHRPDDWVVKAFAWVWSKESQAKSSYGILFEPLKNFVLASWIDDQVAYYRKTSKKHRQRHTRLARGGETLFALTLVIAIIHATGLVNQGLASIFVVPDILVALGVILPAVAAALAGIRIHREYLRNAEQYGNIACHLTAISNDIKQTSDMQTLTGLLEEANEVMLREHQHWREVLSFRKLETP